MHKKKCGCLSEVQRSQRIGICAIVVNSPIEIVKVRLQRNARGPKVRPVGKVMVKLAH